MITFSIYQGRGGQWYWRARSSNGKIVADGAEGYVTKSNAKRAVMRFCRTALRGDWKLDLT